MSAFVYGFRCRISCVFFFFPPLFFSDCLNEGQKERFFLKACSGELCFTGLYSLISIYFRHINGCYSLVEVLLAWYILCWMNVGYAVIFELDFGYLSVFLWFFSCVSCFFLGWWYSTWKESVHLVKHKCIHQTKNIYIFYWISGQFIFICLLTFLQLTKSRGILIWSNGHWLWVIAYW